MKKKLNRFVSLCVACTLVVVLSACGGNGANNGGGNDAENATNTSSANAEGAAKEKGPITLKLQTHYNNENEKASVDAALVKLKELYPNVTIEPEGYADVSALKARIAAADLPDIFELDSSTFDLAVKSNSIIPLDDYVEKYKIKDILSPSVAESLKAPDGKIWGLPMYGPMYHTMFYNKELFDSNGIKVPTNFDELLTAAEAFQAKGITPVAISGKTNWAAGALFDMFAQRVNPRGWMALQDGSAKAEDFRPAIEKIEKAVKAGVFPKGVAITDYDPARTPFHEGKAAMLIIGEWEVSEGQEALGEKLQYMTQFPTADAGSEYPNPGVMPGGAQSNKLYINSDVEDPDYVAEILASYYKLYQEAQYTKLQVIWNTIKTDGLTTEKPMAPLVSKYIEEKAGLKPGNDMWLGSSDNQKFDVGFHEELQKLLQFESTDQFIANVDKLIAGTRK